MLEAARINGTLLERIISSFILSLLSSIKKIFTGIDPTGFKKDNSCFTVLYSTNRIEERRKYAKLSIGADVLQQVLCAIKTRRAPTRHDNIDFRPRTLYILPLFVVTADKGYDSEDYHVLVGERLHALSVIPARCEHVPIWKTHGRNRKQMKRGYCKMPYNQRNKKDESIISVIKRLFG